MMLSDLVGIAETGSGKTLGFLIPGIVRMNAKKNNRKQRNKQPSILVLAPTRELAMQSDEVCNSAVGLPKIKSVCIAGGFDRHSQCKLISSGVQIVFATPGRLISLCESEEIDLSQICYLVLDEADRMLDMGFEP
jgi:superfamily II DNA/RNA helicase